MVKLRNPNPPRLILLVRLLAPSVGPLAPSCSAPDRRRSPISLTRRPAPGAAADVVVDLARLHGLLELAWDDDVERLAARLAPGTTRVVLDPADTAAYQRP